MIRAALSRLDWRPTSGRAARVHVSNATNWIVAAPGGRASRYPRNHKSRARPVGRSESRDSPDAQPARPPAPNRREWSLSEPCSCAEGGAAACSILANRTAQFFGSRPAARRLHSSRAIVEICPELTSASSRPGARPATRPAAQKTERRDHRTRVRPPRSQAAHRAILSSPMRSRGLAEATIDRSARELGRGAPRSLGGR